jgi:hypothetical protein
MLPFFFHAIYAILLFMSKSPDTCPQTASIQEIEAWFIADETHYQRISSALSIEKVNSIAGIDIQKLSKTEKTVPPFTLTRKSI